jgi:hypothetical protein
MGECYVRSAECVAATQRQQHRGLSLATTRMGTTARHAYRQPDVSG